MNRTIRAEEDFAEFDIAQNNNNITTGTSPSQDPSGLEPEDQLLEQSILDKTDTENCPPSPTSSVDSDDYSILRDDSMDDLMREIDSMHQQPIGKNKTDKSPKPILKKPIPSSLTATGKHVNFPITSTPPVATTLSNSITPPPSTIVTATTATTQPEKLLANNKENQQPTTTTAEHHNIIKSKTTTTAGSIKETLSIDTQKQIEKLLNENCDLKLELTALKRELMASKKQQKKAHKHYKKVESDYQTMKQNQCVLMEKLEKTSHERTSLVSQFKKQTQKQKSEEKFIEECKKIKDSVNSVMSVPELHKQLKNKTWHECTIESNMQLSQINEELTDSDLNDNSELKKFTIELIKDYIEKNMTVNDLKNNIVELGLKKEQDYREMFATLCSFQSKAEMSTRPTVTTKPTQNNNSTRKSSTRK